MENFKHCLWLIPTLEHEWYTYTNNFNPHISIQTHIEEDDLYKYSHFLNKNIYIRVKLQSPLYQTSQNNFYALQCNVLIDDPCPDWWPEDAHISFRYQYDKSFSDDEIKDVEKLLIVRESIFDNIVLMKCEGHYSDWVKV